MTGYWTAIIGAITTVGVAWWVLNYSKTFGSELKSVTSASANVEKAFQGG
jgi:hypothetical protein